MRFKHIALLLCSFVISCSSISPTEIAFLKVARPEMDAATKAMQSLGDLRGDALRQAVISAAEVARESLSKINETEASKLQQELKNNLRECLAYEAELLDGVLNVIDGKVRAETVTPMQTTVEISCGKAEDELRRDIARVGESNLR